MSDMYSANALEQIAINLFYGWGYNFYRKENQLRADDQLVRSKVSWLLGLAYRQLDDQRNAFRRRYLPMPTRDRPTPDADAIERAQTLDQLAGNVSRLESTIRNAPVPENDRMTQRYRKEAETLRKLQGYDKLLAGAAQVVLSTVDGKDYEWLLTHIQDIRTGLSFIEGTLRDRQSLLQ